MNDCDISETCSGDSGQVRNNMPHSVLSSSVTFNYRLSVPVVATINININNIIINNKIIFEHRFYCIDESNNNLCNCRNSTLLTFCITITPVGILKDSWSSLHIHMQDRVLIVHLWLIFYAVLWKPFTFKCLSVCSALLTYTNRMAHYAILIRYDKL